MAISCQALYQDVSAELGAGVGNQRLANSFVRAVNRSLSELAVKSDKSTNFNQINSTDDLIADLQDIFQYVLYAGLLYYMIRMGHRPSDPKTAAIVYRDSEARWKDGMGDYMMWLDNQKDPNSDNIIGWGSTALTDSSLNPIAYT